MALWWIFRVWHIRFILWRVHTFDMFAFSQHGLCRLIAHASQKLYGCMHVCVCGSRWSIFGNLSLASAKCILACVQILVECNYITTKKYQMSTKRREWHYSSLSLLLLSLNGSISGSLNPWNCKWNYRRPYVCARHHFTGNAHNFPMNFATQKQ